MHGYIVGVVCAVFGFVAGVHAQPATTSPDDADGAQRKVVLTQELKETIDGKASQVVVLELTYPPGAGTPKHQHAGLVFVYVIEGAVESQIEGQPLQTYKEGETFFEPAGALHLVARHASADKPAKFLAVFLTKTGEPQLTTLVK
jgi:quercetin dioxygenase-like cupin family protein